MSQPFSNQPFANQPVTPPVAGGPVPPGGYGQTPFAPPPQQKSRWWMYLLGGCGCSGVLLLLCCGGAAFFGITKGGQMIGGAVKEQLEAEIADNADVEEHLGEIQSLDMDFMASGQETQNRGGNGNWLVLKAKGKKGDGTFIVQANNDPKAEEKFNKIELKLPDGKMITIK